MSGVVEGADVRMIQTGNSFCFALKSLAQFGAIGEMRGQDFYRDGSIKPRIAGFINFAHSAGTYGG